MFHIQVTLDVCAIDTSCINTAAPEQLSSLSPRKHLSLMEEYVDGFFCILKVVGEFEQHLKNLHYRKILLPSPSLIASLNPCHNEPRETNFMA